MVRNLSSNDTLTYILSILFFGLSLCCSATSFFGDYENIMLKIAIYVSITGAVTRFYICQCIIISGALVSRYLIIVSFILVMCGWLIYSTELILNGKIHTENALVLLIMFSSFLYNGFTLNALLYAEIPSDSISLTDDVIVGGRIYSIPNNYQNRNDNYDDQQMLTDSDENMDKVEIDDNLT